MDVQKTSIDGVLIFTPKIFKDERGFFYESFREDDYRNASITEDLIQDNISLSKKNVLRGLHYNLTQGQLASITHGKVFDVIVDIRPNSPTYKKHLAFTLDGDNPQQIYMPPGIAHGFCVLSDFAIINYKCSQYYNAANEQGILWNDPILAIEWPIKNPLISEKDKQFQCLK